MYIHLVLLTAVLFQSQTHVSNNINRVYAVSLTAAFQVFPIAAFPTISEKNVLHKN